ncbi:MAG: sodium/substrate symporter small subunit [Bauldia sp.]
MADPRQAAWWRRTAALAAAVVVVWALIGVVLQVFDLGPEGVDPLGFPLAWFLAAILAPVVMAIVLFLYVPWQRVIDRSVDGTED